MPNTSRNHSIDLLKLLSVFGVVVIHLSPTTLDGEWLASFFLSFVVPFFYLISLYFFVLKLSSVSSVGFANLRLGRLLIPYLVWSCIYVLMRWIKFSLASRPFDLDIPSAFLFGGAAVHLYFIPMLLWYQALSLVLFSVARPLNSKVVPLIIACVVFFYGYLGQLNDRFLLLDALAQGLLYVGSACFLLFLGATDKGRRLRAAIGLFVIPFLLLVSFHFASIKSLGIFAGPIAGLLFSAFVLSFDLAIKNRMILYAMTCSYGIYLAHFAFLEVFEYAVETLGFSVAPYSAIDKIVVASFVSVLSVLAVFIARRHHLLAYACLGESIRR
jgi:peptidoglycan/LPS O-acetylase OafA/YrhL